MSMLPIHVIAGLLALMAGAFALAATKGSTPHRRAGTAFVVAMIVMTSTAAAMALTTHPNRVNVVAALVTLYLVVTAWLTIKRPVDQTRPALAGLMVGGLATGAYAVSLGLEALADPRGIVDEVPAGPLFMFAAVGLGGALLDARLLWAGAIRGAHRLARHLWRMTFAMWIATTSFFLGQAKLFPDPVRKIELLAIPVLVVTLLLLYWLVRVLIKRERAIGQGVMQ